MKILEHGGFVDKNLLDAQLVKRDFGFQKLCKSLVELLFRTFKFADETF